MIEWWYHLVLSGWGVRWLAHIGMYKALQEYGYTIHSVSWTSAGALVWAFIAAGKSAQEIEEIFHEYSIFNLLKPTLSSYGIFSMSIIAEAMKKYIPYDNIAHLPLPLRVCVSDINNAQVRYYEQWNIIDIITASCSIPWLFKPVLYEWYYLIDGGIFDNFPVPLDKNIPIIGHHVNPRSTTKCRNTKEIVARSLDLLVSRDIQTQSKLCTIFLEPPKLSSIQQSPFINIEKVIKIWYEYALTHLDKK